MLLNSQQSCVINGGNTTSYFNLGKGAFLFILALEVLFVFIKSNENIKSIKTFKHIFLYTGYAGYSSFFLRDIPSVKELMNSFNQFYFFSGLRANIEKRGNSWHRFPERGHRGSPWYKMRCFIK